MGGGGLVLAERKPDNLNFTLGAGLPFLLLFLLGY